MRKLCNKEKRWIELLFNLPFKDSDVLLEQIQKSLIVPDYNEGYISLKFHMPANKDTVIAYPHTVRVPVEMYCNIDDKAPSVFILHVLEGYVDELEIFNADSSKIDHDLTIKSYQHNINCNLV